MKTYLSGIIFFILCSLLVLCTQPTTVTEGGGGSEVEVVGYVLLPGGVPAPSTQVMLIPSDYDASFVQENKKIIMDTSDASGRYKFDNVTPGTYNVQAVQLEKRTRMLVTGVEVSEGDTIAVRPDSLVKPGSVKLYSQSKSGEVCVTIPGTDIAKSVEGSINEIILDSVPAGIIPEIRYTVIKDSIVVKKQNIIVKSSDTTLLAVSWDYLRRIFLNTTASGADVNTDVYSFPVLIRLSNSNFDFSKAKGNGEDIRFTSVQGSPLPHEIELWDSTSGKAAIWVNIDTVYGNDSTQSIVMQWGNSKADNFTDGTLVFDTAAGFQGVWHLGDSEADSVRDATVNDYDGFSSDSTRPSIGTGAIGNCRIFDGKSDYITMSNTASSKINFAQDGYYTVSAWVYVDSLDGKSHCVVSKGYTQYYMRFTYVSRNIINPKPLWEFVEFNESKAWQVLNCPATSKQWVYLVGVRKGTEQFLYCNGDPVSSALDIWENQDVSRETTDDLSVGRFADAIKIPSPEGYCYFKGGIDEIQILNTAQSEDWIKLSYMNQRSDDYLVVFK